MSHHERRIKEATAVAASSIPNQFPKTLEATDYSIVKIKDDGWCLYNAFLKRFKLDGSENALKLAHIVADRFRDEMVKTTDFNYFDTVVGNTVYDASGEIIDGITGIASQDPAKPSDPYITVNGVKRAVIFENEFIDSITSLRVPNNIETGPIAYPESQGFFIILNDIFKNIRPVFYQEGGKGRPLELQSILTTLNSPPKDNTVYVFIKYDGRNHFDFIQPTASGSLNWSLKVDPGKLLTQRILDTKYGSVTKETGSSGSNSAASVFPEGEGKSGEEEAVPQPESVSGSNSAESVIAEEEGITSFGSNSASSPAVKTDPWIFYKLLLRASKREEEVTDINALLAACAIASYIRDKDVTDLDIDYFYTDIPFSTITSTQIIAGLITPIDRYNLALGPVFRPIDIRGIEVGLTALFPHVTFRQESTIINKNQPVSVTFNDALTDITETFGVLPNMLEDPRCRYDRDNGLDMVHSGGEFEKVFGPPPTFLGFRKNDTVTNKRLVKIAYRIYKPGKSVPAIPVGSSSAATAAATATATATATAVPDQEEEDEEDEDDEDDIGMAGSQGPGPNIELPELSREEVQFNIPSSTSASSATTAEESKEAAATATNEDAPFIAAYGSNSASSSNAYNGPGTVPSDSVDLLHEARTSSATGDRITGVSLTGAPAGDRRTWAQFLSSLATSSSIPAPPPSIAPGPRNGLRSGLRSSLPSTATIMTHIAQNVAAITAASAIGLNPEDLDPPSGDDPEPGEFELNEGEAF